MIPADMIPPHPIPPNPISPNTAQELDAEHLDWLAFRYLCDELDEPTLADFELLLANHLPAQQALAQAVELYATSHLALATHTRSTDLNPKPASVPLSVRVAHRRRLLVALASTACAVLCMVGSLFLPDNRSRDLPGNQSLTNGPFLTDTAGASAAASATETDQQAADLLTSWAELAATTNSDQTLTRSIATTSIAPAQSADLAGDTEHSAQLTELATDETVNEELTAEYLTTDEISTDELIAEQSAVPDWLLTAVAVASADENTYPSGLQELPN